MIMGQEELEKVSEKRKRSIRGKFDLALQSTISSYEPTLVQ
jgi:hypothetical protein